MVDKRTSRGANNETPGGRWSPGQLNLELNQWGEEGKIFKSENRQVNKHPFF